MAHEHLQLTGDLDDFVEHFTAQIVHGSATASDEGGSDHRIGDARMAVRTFERYSATGGNRLGMTVSVLGVGDQLSVAVTTSGGSQAMFFKVNTWGESAFMDHAIAAINSYQPAPGGA